MFGAVSHVFCTALRDIRCFACKADIESLLVLGEQRMCRHMPGVLMSFTGYGVEGVPRIMGHDGGPYNGLVDSAIRNEIQGFHVPSRF